MTRHEAEQLAAAHPGVGLDVERGVVRRRAGPGAEHRLTLAASGRGLVAQQRSRVLYRDGRSDEGASWLAQASTSTTTLGSVGR